MISAPRTFLMKLSSGPLSHSQHPLMVLLDSNYSQCTKVALFATSICFPFAHCDFIEIISRTTTRSFALMRANCFWWRNSNALSRHSGYTTKFRRVRDCCNESRRSVKQTDLVCLGSVLRDVLWSNSHPETRTSRPLRNFVTNVCVLLCQIARPPIAAKLPSALHCTTWLSAFMLFLLSKLEQLKFKILTF